MKNYRNLNKNLINYFYLKKFKIKIINQIFILKKLKNKKVDQNLKYFYLNKKNYKLKNLINVIVGISLYKNNIVVFITDIKGKMLFFKTSGILDIETKKKKKNDIILKLLSSLLKEKKFFKPNTFIALHLKNSNKKISNFIIKFLFNNLEHKNIKIIKIKNNKPHNGCRPKKIRRKKLGKINFN